MDVLYLNFSSIMDFLFHAPAVELFMNTMLYSQLFPEKHSEFCIFLLEKTKMLPASCTLRRHGNFSVPGRDEYAAIQSSEELQIFSSISQSN